MRVLLFLVLLIQGQCVLGQNATLSPQQSPTMGPTLTPSISISPTISPPPSAYPTTSPSAYPTSQPSLSSRPTISPRPSSHPTSTPSAMPSLNSTIIAKRYYIQTLLAEKEFETGELGVFKKYQESFTHSFEYGVTEHILTECTVISQVFNVTTSILSINYSMNYTTNYMAFENVIEFPDKFYESQNMTILTEELVQRGFSPTLQAIDLVMLDEGEAITAAPIFQPSSSPVASIATMSPTLMITDSPTKGGASLLLAEDGESVDNENADDSDHSDSAVTDTPGIPQQNDDFSSTSAPSSSPPINGLISNTGDQKKSGLGVGLGVGIFVASLACVGGLFTWMHFRNKQQSVTSVVTSTIDEEAQEAPRAPQDNPALLIINSEKLESPESSPTEECVDIGAAQTDLNQTDDHTTGTTSEHGNVFMPMLITDLDASETESDIQDEFSFNEEADIFDSYKNNQLEELREKVTSIIGDTEGMMSLAMTQSLLEDSDAAENILGDAENPSEIEANLLFETKDWMRKNQECMTDVHEFFQEILNRMVIIVRVGIIHPLDASRIVFCCAAILGMPLLKDFPDDMLLVAGMRKTNDASEGQAYLVDAFSEFGRIDGAAVALDKGFGYVRFADSGSVDHALKRFRTAEIEVQGVSVMIHALR